MGKPWIQVSVDTQDVASGFAHVDHALAIGAEWIEVGTPLLTFSGIGAIGSIAEYAPEHTIVADFKALDGVAQYFTRAGELGAGVATVMAVANEASIMKAIEAGHEAGVKIQVDMLGISPERLPECARHMQTLGADYILLHLAIDELMRTPSSDPLEGLESIVSACDLPVGPVVFNVRQGVDAIIRGASYVVVGYPLLTVPDARRQLTDFASAVRKAGARL